ncbi:MAG: Rpn family recombination-promoting nuclease/putative transposase [Micrococcales bacterium]|nr:Rpn family recombination-promoting nuclease/putative transposase [Micrococcales bacterium]
MTNLQRYSAPILHPRNDLLFRRLFANQNHVPLLRSLLAALLADMPDKEWTELTVSEPHLLGDDIHAKEAVLDVLVHSGTDILVDIEIQLLDHRGVRERIVFYLARLLASRQRAGQPYHRMRPAIVLVITGFDLVTTDEDYAHRYVLYDEVHRDLFSGVIQVRTLELSKLGANDGTAAWSWLRFIAATTEEELDMAAEGNPEIAAAATLVRRFSADETVRQEIEAREKFLWDQQAREYYAREEGREQGREEGREEGRAAMAEVVRSILGRGMSVEEAASITGLDPAEVARLGGILGGRAHRTDRRG